MKQQSLRVLVADDEPSTRRALSLLLRSDGYLAETAENATEALSRAEKARFDVVVTDVDMGATNGLALLRELRARGSAAHVIVMSGSADAGLPERALALGAMAFLEKPFDYSALDGVLRRLAPADADGTFVRAA